jgi:hypothetical protein
LKVWKIASVILFFISISSSVQAQAIIYKFTTTYEIVNRGDETIELLEEDISVPLFMNTPWQTVSIYNSSHELITKVIDEDGNHGAVINIQKQLTAGESIDFEISYIIKSQNQPKPKIKFSMAEGLDSIPGELVDIYSIGSETFTIENPEISSLAFRLTKDEQTVLEKVVRILAWFKENTTYNNYEVPLYPTKTLKEGLGDCDDQSILFITMCRSLGIPAYLQVGILIHSSIEDNKTSWEGHLSSSQVGLGWHGWAMIYLPPWGWIPIDLTLTQSEEGIDVLKKSPEYENYVIAALNISKQAYIGDTLVYRERIIENSLYITLTNEIQIIERNPIWINYGVIGLGLAIAISIILLYQTNIRAREQFNV